MTYWTATITGDMTLSILDEGGLKILGVDMLKSKTMAAGDNGNLLAQTLNDLKSLCQAADSPPACALTLADPTSGLSPRPWRLEVDEQRRRMRLRDANRRLIGDRSFPDSVPTEVLEAIAQKMAMAVQRINASDIE